MGGMPKPNTAVGALFRTGPTLGAKTMKGFNGTPTTTKPNKSVKGTAVKPKAAGSDDMKKSGKGKK
tara:strand:- start:328 stop:525 length:198 start_codon:yes stop_codon:yes gene_type:complete